MRRIQHYLCTKDGMLNVIQTCQAHHVGLADFNFPKFCSQVYYGRQIKFLKIYR